MPPRLPERRRSASGTVPRDEIASRPLVIRRLAFCSWGVGDDGESVPGVLHQGLDLLECHRRRILFDTAHGRAAPAELAREGALAQASEAPVPAADEPHALARQERATGCHHLRGLGRQGTTSRSGRRRGFLLDHVRPVQAVQAVLAVTRIRAHRALHRAGDRLLHRLWLDGSVHVVERVRRRARPRGRRWMCGQRSPRGGRCGQPSAGTRRRRTLIALPLLRHVSHRNGRHDSAGHGSEYGATAKGPEEQVEGHLGGDLAAR